MGFLGFLIFAVKCLDVLAWPLLALGYPLCASIRAIESNSNSDMQKLITYWILFSLISLFELAFVQLIEWLPFWPYIKLIAISWLALPSFDGAYHVYECLVRPLLSMNPRVVLNQFNKPKEELSLKTEDFLAMAETYVKENGSEALEKFIASKSKGAEPNNDAEVIKAVANSEKKEVATAIQMDSKYTTAVAKGLNCKEPNVAQKHMKGVQLAEKNAATATIWSKGAKPNNDVEVIKAIANTEKKEVATTIQMDSRDTPAVSNGLNSSPTCLHFGEMETPLFLSQGDGHTTIQVGSITIMKGVQLSEKNAAVATVWVKCAESNLEQADKRTVAAVEIKEMKAESSADNENKLPEITTSKEVQKEWTCAVCQMTMPSEAVLDNHLQGRKHRAKCEKLEAGKQTDKNKKSSSSTTNQSDQTNQEPKRHVPRNGPNKNGTKKQEEKVQVKGTSEQCNQKNVNNTNAVAGMWNSTLWCNICNITCTSQIDLASHLSGSKHQLRIQEMFGSGDGWSYGSGGGSIYGSGGGSSYGYADGCWSYGNGDGCWSYGCGDGWS